MSQVFGRRGSAKEHRVSRSHEYGASSVSSPVVRYSFFCPLLSALPHFPISYFTSNLWRQIGGPRLIVEGGPKAAHLLSYLGGPAE